MLIYGACVINDRKSSLFCLSILTLRLVYYFDMFFLFSVCFQVNMPKRVLCVEKAFYSTGNLCSQLAGFVIIKMES